MGVPQCVWNWFGWGAGYLLLVGLIAFWNHRRCLRDRGYWHDRGSWPR